MSLNKFPNPVPRADVIAGLRQLADFLDDHPAIPTAPYGWDVLVSTHEHTDQAGKASVDHIAAILGVRVDDQTGDGGHYCADRAFGPITYRAFHIPARLKQPGAQGEPSQAAP
jgi:hypothetical protein